MHRGKMWRQSRASTMTSGTSVPQVREDPVIMLMTMISSIPGKLSPQKFTELCRKVLGSDQAETLQQKAFGQFDKHNDGTINFRDFLMVVHLTSNGSAEDKLRTMFSLYDVDGNGTIEASEMERCIHL